MEKCGLTNYRKLQEGLNPSYKQRWLPVLYNIIKHDINKKPK